MLRGLFQWVLLAVLLGSCAPRTARHKDFQAEGTYMVSANRLYDDDGDFDIRKQIVYYKPETAPSPAEINIPTPQMALNRCGLCHECGFNLAWDRANHGTPEWRPRYRGEAWGPIVQRMRVMDGSLLNAYIADRIYTYLRDESLGIYDPDSDSRGAVVRIVDELPEDIVIESPGTAERRRAQEGREQQDDAGQDAGDGQS